MNGKREKRTSINESRQQTAWRKQERERERERERETFHTSKGNMTLTGCHSQCEIIMKFPAESSSSSIKMDIQKKRKLRRKAIKTKKIN